MGTLKKLNLLLLSVLLFLASCSPYQKLLKSDNTAEKYKAAEEYFNKGDYQRAMPLLQSVLQELRGTLQAERAYYYLAYSYYKLGEYQVAAFSFKSFAEAYPLSEYREDAYFYYAYSLYLDSPDKDLDQNNTRLAMDAFQLYLDKYPMSERVEECNRYIDVMREKLEDKAVENALLYYKTHNYKSAVWAIEHVLELYPLTEDKEMLKYHVVRSAYLLAENSVEKKKIERYNDAIRYYGEFVEMFPESKYLNELKKIERDSRYELEKLEKKEAAQKTGK